MKKNDVNNTIKNSENVKNYGALKTCVLLLAFIIAYAISLYLNGFNETNKKLILLVAFGVVGFLLFYVVYYLAYFISFLSLKRKAKKLSNNVINCDDELAEYFSGDDVYFKYKGELTLKNNLSNFASKISQTMNDIASKYSQESEYAYVNYTVYDALDIFGNAINYLHNGIDKYFKGLNLQNWSFINLKGVIEKSLDDNKIEELAVTVEESSAFKKFFTNVKNKIVDKSKKIGNYIISAPLTSLLNDVLVFVAGEGFRVFSKNGKKPKTKKVVENNNE